MTDKYRDTTSFPELWRSLLEENKDKPVEEVRKIYSRIATRHDLESYFLKFPGDPEKAKKEYQKYKDLRKGVNTLEHFKELYGETEGEERYKRFRQNAVCNLEHLQKKYGEQEGAKRYQEILDKRVKSLTLDGKIEKYGLEEGTKRHQKFLEKMKFVSTKEGFIDKYGEVKGARLYDEMKERQSHGQTLDGYIEKYGPVEGPRRYEKWIERFRYSHTLEGYIEKYGEEEGRARYNSYMMKIQETSKELGVKGYSNISKKLFDEVSKLFPENSFQFGDNEKIISVEGHIYRLDFFDPDTKIAVEFFGDYWHKNVRRHKDDEDITDDDIQQFEKDLDRLRQIEGTGELSDDILVIWEEDYLNDPENCVNQIVELIKKFKK